MVAPERTLEPSLDPGNDKLRERLDRLGDYDLRPAKAYAVRTYGWSAEQADRAELRTKQFFALEFLDPEKERVVDGEIDQFWHAMILNTVLYQQFCADIFDGTTIHHVPDGADIDPGNVRRTDAVLTVLFGQGLDQSHKMLMPGPRPPRFIARDLGLAPTPEFTQELERRIADTPVQAA
jgi:hypothetical protein